MEAIVKLLKERNSYQPKAFFRVIVNGRPLGFTHRSYEEVVKKLDRSISIREGGIHIETTQKDPISITNFFKRINHQLVKDNVIHVTHNSEMCPIGIHDINQPLFDIYRYAIPFWGMRLCGVHLNGLLKVNGDLHMWVSRRTLNRHEPGKLDHLACGAVVSHLGIKKNLYKEAEEEASITPAMVDKAAPVGVVACSFQRNLQMCRYTPFMYDWWVPNGFQPVSLDKSTSEFFIMPLQSFIEEPSKLEQFKTASQLVIINLLMRYGLLKPDMPYYPLIATLLQKGLTNVENIVE